MTNFYKSKLEYQQIYFSDIGHKATSNDVT